MAGNYEGLPPEIEKLSERLAKDPKSLVFSSLANAYRKNNMIDEAIEILQKGLEIHPNYASARIVLGRCYADKRMYEMAKVEFKKALEKDPQNIVVLEKLGEIYKTLNQNEEAYDIYKKLLELDPLNELFEREVELLKNLSREIAPDSQEYSNFQTIQKQRTEEKKKREEIDEKDKTAEPEVSMPSFTEIFEEPSDAPEKPSEEITEEVEETKEKEGDSAATSFSEMVKEEPSLLEQPPISEEKPSIPEEPVETVPPQGVEPVTIEPEEKKPPTEITQPEEIKQPEEDLRMEGITSIFDEENLKTSKEPPKKEETPLTEDIASKLSMELEKRETEIKPEKPPEIIQEAKIEEQEAIEPEQKEKQKGKPAATETLAEIYLNQGFVEEALTIYKEILDENPENATIKKKIEELEKKNTAEQNPQAQQVEEKPKIDTKSQNPTEEEKRNQAKNLNNFQDWLKKFKSEK
ncbi:tetratricopeptide repeat protein [candidate division WOR-3 bacterium]|nr:tetratricopeptide repeat protein [candidate division WOR-3 bacterium]